MRRDIPGMETTGMQILLHSFLSDETGVVAVEYGLIVALVGLAAVFALQALGESVGNLFFEVSSQLNDALSQAQNT